MADKKKSSSKSSSAKDSSQKATTRVVASTASSKKTSKKAATKTAKAAAAKTEKPTAASVKSNKKRAPKQKRDGYFRGAWYELRQVRWPNRSATWKLTFAVIAYSLFFFVMVIILDAIFKYFFDLLIK